MDYANLLKTLALLALGFLVIARWGVPKGQFWDRTKRSFRRSPILNLAAFALVVFILAYSAFPQMRPEWVNDAVDILSVLVVVLFLSGVLWARKKGRVFDERHHRIVGREVNSIDVSHTAHMEQVSDKDE